MSQITGPLINRKFTQDKSRAADLFEWQNFDLSSSGTSSPKSSRYPSSWSVESAVLMSKKLRGQDFETFVDSVLEVICSRGLREGYIETEVEADNLKEELKFAVFSQLITFGSGVWENIGKDNPDRMLADKFIPEVYEGSDEQIRIFENTLNDWNTIPSAGQLYIKDVRQELAGPENSACMIGLVNITKFIDQDGRVKIEELRQAVDLFVLAGDILIGHSDYKNVTMTTNSRAYRQLGVGLAGMYESLSDQNINYDSEEARAQVASLTALITGQAYVTSARLAQKLGPFAGFHKNREATLGVLQMHRDKLAQIKVSSVSEELLSSAASTWDDVVSLSESNGVRNSQLGLIDSRSDTYRLLGLLNGGVNVPSAGGVLAESQIKMIGAVQPFISGVLAPDIAVIHGDIKKLDKLAQDSGLKARVFKLGYKQHAVNKVEDSVKPKSQAEGLGVKKLPKQRTTRSFDFVVGELRGVLHVGEFSDGLPGEIGVLLQNGSESTKSAIDAFATSVSWSLQNGLELAGIIEKLLVRGYGAEEQTDDPEVEMVGSLVDYIVRRVALTYLDENQLNELQIKRFGNSDESQTSLLAE